MRTDRELWADTCRTISTLGVITIHASGETFYQFNKIPDRDWLFANFIDSLVRCSVPLFVMLSGYLILNSDRSEEFHIRSITKRILRVSIPLLSWSLIYLFFLKTVTGGSFELSILFSRPAMYHLWFVYMIIGLYIIYPIFFVVFRYYNSNIEAKVYIIAIWIIFNSISIYIKIPAMNLLQLDNIFGYGGYFLLGAFLGGSLSSRIGWLPIILVYSLSTMATFFATWHFSSATGSASELAYSYFSPNVLIGSVAVFLFCQKLDVPDKFKKYVIKLSDVSFMVFFMHILVLEYVKLYTLPLSYKFSIPLYIATISIITFSVSVIISIVLRYIPGSRQFIG
jgi:surface polysaccharide O-acyltransferase-like enzyme